MSGLKTPPFTADRMAALRPGIEAMAERLVDEMVAHGGPADLRARLAFPLPVWVICDLLGVPDTDRDRFSRWSDALLNVTRYTQEEVDAAQDAYVDYMAAHVVARQHDRQDGGPAAHRPPPLGTAPRRPLPGRAGRRGGAQDRCRPGRRAANRDESVFGASDELTLDRWPNAHLAFGVGPHLCLGQSLARVELRTVLDVLLRRLPSLELAVAADDLRRLEGLAVGGLSEVPVRW